MSRTLIAGLVLACFGIAGAHANDGRHSVPGEKLDSGLGSLPHYKQWKGHPGRASVAAQRERSRMQPNGVNGEKQDSGLGELPPYSEWKNVPALAPLVVAETSYAVARRPAGSGEREIASLARTSD